MTLITLAAFKDGLCGAFIHSGWRGALANKSGRCRGFPWPISKIASRECHRGRGRVYIATKAGFFHKYGHCLHCIRLPSMLASRSIRAFILLCLAPLPSLPRCPSSISWRTPFFAFSRCPLVALLVPSSHSNLSASKPFPTCVEVYDVLLPSLHALLSPYFHLPLQSNLYIKPAASTCPSHIRHRELLATPSPLLEAILVQCHSTQHHGYSLQYYLIESIEIEGNLLQPVCQLLLPLQSPLSSQAMNLEV